MNLTHQELRMLARWMRRLGDEVHGVEEDLAHRVANYLDAQAAAMEAAAAPAQPAAVEPRCERCRWWKRGICRRFPNTVYTAAFEFCGEFTPQEVTP